MLELNGRFLNIIMVYFLMPLDWNIFWQTLYLFTREILALFVKAWEKSKGHIKVKLRAHAKNFYER